MSTLTNTRIHLLGISGSLRRAANSTAILRTLKEELEFHAEVSIFSLEPLPLYNADLDGEHMPEVVRSFKNAIAASDGLLIVSPEYNYGIPGVLKNALDWASRPAYQSVLKGKHAVIITSAGGILGGVRAQAQILQTLASTLARVLAWPEVAIPKAGEKISNGRLVDELSLRLALEAVHALLREIRASRQQLVETS